MSPPPSPSLRMTLPMRLTPFRLCGVRAASLPRSARPFSSAATGNAAASQGDAESPKEQLNSRWLSDLKTRIAKIKEASPDKTDRANEILRNIDLRWLDLLAGPQGFSTNPGWRALDRREIIWGDIVSLRMGGARPSL